MPRSNSSVPAVDPIELLSQQIVPAVKKKGNIKLATGLIDAVKAELKAVRTSEASALDTCVATIVLVLDEHEKTCSRLDSATFSIILQTLLHAQYSRQKERGIILLTVSLHHDAHKKPPLRTIKVRKIAIGKECLQPLLSYFTNTLENTRIRRWVGVLMIQLFEDNDENILEFEASPEDKKRKLGTMVVEEQNEILRSTCGQLLKALVAWGIRPENLWPVGTDPMQYKDFPTSSQSEKQWNNAFQTYIDKVLENSDFSQGSGTLYFAQALAINPMEIMISGGIISILLDGDISISTQPNDDSFTKSLEIPSQLIVNAKIEETLLDGVVPSATSPVDLVIELKISSELSCYMNALPVYIRGLRITVKDENLANDLCREISGEKSIQKASQSKETISIASVSHDAISPEENEIVEDSYKGRVNICLDPAVLLSRDESQDDQQDIDFDNFIAESPQEGHIRDTDEQFKARLGKPLAVDAGVAGEPMYENNQDKADDQAPFRSSAPARLSRQIESDTGTLLDKQNSRHHDVNMHDGVPTRTLRRKAPLLKSVLKPIGPARSSADDSEEVIRSAASHAAARLAPAQQKAKFLRPKPKPKPKAKQKVSKSESPKEEMKRVKRYSLKTRPGAPVINVTASKRASEPKTSAPRTSVSKTGLKVSAPKAASTPKTASVHVAKAPRKTASKLLVPKKPSVARSPKRLMRQSQANFPDLDSEPQERRNSPASPEGHAALSSGLDAQAVLVQKFKATDPRTSRLSQALADINDVEQDDASFGELTQTSLMCQPLQVNTQPERSASPAIQNGPEPAQEEADFLENSTPEIMHVVSQNNTNLLPYVEIQSESSPSSLDRVSPVPLPAQELCPARYSSEEATTLRSKILAGPVGLRRSPRLASKYSPREASVALSSVQVEAPRRVRKPIAIDLNGNDEAQHKGGSWDDDSPLRANEAPLFDDHLARKTPLVSFGAKGPRNQGVSNLKTYSLQRIRRRKVEVPENRPLLAQKSMPIRSSKRKRDKQDSPVMENNKRQQTSRLQNSKDRTIVARENTLVTFRNEENAIVPRYNAAARNTARFGSQGSRVNENGSPRGNTNSLQEHTNYKAIAGKVLTGMRPTAMINEFDGDAFCHHVDDERLNVVESDQSHPNLPVTSYNSFKVWPLSPRLDEEVIKRYLPHPKATNLEYREIETKVDHHRQDKIEDPFLKESPEKYLSSFAQRLQYRRQTPTRRARKNLASPILLKTNYIMDEDPEETLVNVENENPMGEDSSSSDITSESSDEDQDHEVQRGAVEVQQVQCDEWRMALKPHQRGILDVLNQVSADLVRHLIRHEEAAEDVLTEYEQGSTILIRNLEKDHQDDRRRIQRELDKVKRTMMNEYREARLEISRINKAIRARPVRALEKEWMQEQDRLQRLVEEGMKKCR